jgi:hypothetical protein
MIVSMYNPLLIAAINTSGLKGLLITFLIAVIIIFVVAGLIYLIETYINKAPLPTPVRLVIALIMVVCVILWAISNFL